MRLFRKYAINANNKQTFKINNHMVDSDNTLVVLLRIIITFNPSVGTFYRIMNVLGLGLKLNFYNKKGDENKFAAFKICLKRELA